jgi:hypothetical protein
VDPLNESSDRRARRNNKLTRPQAAVRLADSLAAHLTALTLGGADTRDTQPTAAAPDGAAAGAAAGAASANGGAGGGGAGDPDIESFDRAVEGMGVGEGEEVDRRAVPPSYKVRVMDGWLSAC